MKSSCRRRANVQTVRYRAFTLLELLIGFVLVAAVTNATLVISVRVKRNVREGLARSFESGRLSALFDRLRRDIRRATCVQGSGSGATQLVLGFQDGRTVAYGLKDGRLVRTLTVDGAAASRAPDMLFKEIRFSYDTPRPQDARLITVVLTREPGERGKLPPILCGAALRNRREST